MPRLQLVIPETFVYSTRLHVRVGDLASGFHLGNHHLIAYLNEATSLFFRDIGFFPLDIEGMVIINADLAVMYLSESIHGDTLKIKIAMGDLSKHGYDFYYLIINERSGLVTAKASMVFLFFDPKKKIISNIPLSFQTALKKYCSSNAIKENQVHDERKELQ